MRAVSLGSGSSGNALLVEAGPRRRTKLLLDAGLSTRIITERLRMVGVEPDQLQGVLITHEHSDHVLALPLLSKRYALPIITDPRTHAVIAEGMQTGAWRTDSGRLVSGKAIFQGELPYRELPLGSSCTIGDIEVISFATVHDAVAPCGYLLKAGGCRVCIVTDTGEVTAAMLDVMCHADLLILESNHDREQLLRGPYPWPLKRRILSANGHLSNEQAAEAVLRTWRANGPRWLWLAHLSRTNNTPLLALDSVRAYLQAASVSLSQLHIAALPPDMGYVWDSTLLWQA
jgi:phosphoribosyl 1,2-cyclic phosphodiesterase